MEDPLQDIGPIVHQLCQGSPAEQKKALETYFTEDAAFYHPFCRVDNFPGSRGRLLGIFQWYKIMSPKIELDIQSIGRSDPYSSAELTIAAYDEIKQILYVTIHQVFSIRFLFGLHRASVVLTTKLDLQKKGKKYYIYSQNDLYQTDQWIRFITIPYGIGSLFVIAWQWIATINCVILAYIFAPFTAGEQWYHESGRKQLREAREKGIYRIADEARESALSAAEDFRQRITSPANGQAPKLGKGQKQFGDMQVVDTKR